MLKFIGSKKYSVITVFSLWVLTLIFSLLILFSYTAAKNAFQTGFYFLPFLLTLVMIVGIILISKLDVASKMHPVLWIILFLTLFGISWYFAVNRKLLASEEIEFIFKFSLLFSTILTIATSLIALLMKKRVKNAYDLLQELKNRT
ncbi:MAG: hypothetical protein QXT86_07820 [Archaeoglobaceae archaeon]